ncbi:class I SAM-dependent methyltransferase [Kitasatospora sp. NPDC057965]|uniref:class I SAM-dependent methyltransferase n=1 Tax=Kitasatospora sp. NPDC057965 TaxID=3346291 RepID=UPI0036D9DD60
MATGEPGADRPVGTTGYGAAAEELAAQYEAVTFADVHREALYLIPTRPCDVLDVGAGSGRDAAALAALGHRVVAAEPTAELRRIGERLHAGSGVRWVDDALPALPRLGAEGIRFDVVLLTAVWMHLPPDERPSAMAALAGLLAPAGRLFLSVRHGPVPPDRRMYDAPADETLALARAHGLHPLLHTERPDLHGRTDVHWTVLVLAADGPPPARPLSSRSRRCSAGADR